jgi:uncharacterized protein (DUF779 family)
MSVTTATSKVYQAPGHADIDDRQFAVWKHTQLIIDVGAEEPEGFSLPAGDDQHFTTRSRVFSPAELAALAEGERQP